MKAIKITTLIKTPISASHARKLYTAIKTVAEIGILPEYVEVTFDEEEV